MPPAAWRTMRALVLVAPVPLPPVAPRTLRVWGANSDPHVLEYDGSQIR